MAGSSNVLGSSSFRSSSFRARGWRARWALLRDVLGGGLVLAAWIALWTVTWAAVAGPLRDDAPVERARAAAVSAT